LRWQKEKGERARTDVPSEMQKPNRSLEKKLFASHFTNGEQKTEQKQTFNHSKTPVKAVEDERRGEYVQKNVGPISPSTTRKDKHLVGKS